MIITTVLSALSTIIAIGVGLFVIGTKWAKVAGDIRLILFRQNAMDERMKVMETKLDRRR